MVTPPPMPRCVLTINGGSSSIRCAIYEIIASPTAPLHLLVRGTVQRIGQSDCVLLISDSAGILRNTHAIQATSRAGVIGELLNWLQATPWFAAINAVGHRVVHGMTYNAPQLITPELLVKLQGLTTLDPEHLPFEIELINAMQRTLPAVPHIACFDTAFHRSMPRVARMLPLPRRYQAAGVERYGFHGLSYAYLMEELLRIGDSAASNGRVILTHLGNGASLAAVLDGHCIDTSMSFTPASGIMMGTRSGDLDPGLSYYLAQTEHLGAEQYQHLVNHESGLLGISETSADMRDLLAREATDSRAAEAIAMFCYQVKKCIGAYAAALGGVDTLVFAGGIGENSPVIRQRICAGLGFLGINIDEARNLHGAAMISTCSSPAIIRVIRTDEELMIAKSAYRELETIGNGVRT